MSISYKDKKYDSGLFQVDSLNIFKRLVKVAEGLLNYAYTCIKVACDKPDVLHLQWLPFMEVVGWEIPILKFIKRISPKTRLVLTIHNIYPHNMSSERKKAYNARFRKASSLFDDFIVHTKISKEDVFREFGLRAEKVHVCCHGVFEPKGVTISLEYRKDGKLHILQFGGQSFYKGTDLLVDAVCGLDKYVKIDFYGQKTDTYFDEYLNDIEIYQYKGVLQPNEVIPTLKRYDALIFPSHYEGEGCPGILVEALLLLYQLLLLIGNTIMSS